MDEPKRGDLSESEEMYLITVARLVEQGVEEPVPVSQLAGELSIQPVSANQMVHKLAEEGLVEYLPYKGVRLSPNGLEKARQILRDRRLWEVFLVTHLELPAGEADALACRLEHITPREVIAKLDRFLGHPSISPGGLPIPDIQGNVTLGAEASRPLAELPVGEWAEVLHLEGEPATLTFLESEGLLPGVKVSPLASSSQGALLLKVGENTVHLSAAIVGGIWVSRQK